MDALQEETGTWPAAYWFLMRASGVPDHVRYPNKTAALILFSSEDRADKFHDEFPAMRQGCEPEAVAPSQVPALVRRHFPPNTVSSYVLDPSAGDFDGEGRQVDKLFNWPLTLVGLCGYLPA